MRPIITEELRTAYANAGRQAAEITYTKTGEFWQGIIYQDDIIENGLSIDRYCCTSDCLELGSAVAAQLDLTLYDRNGTFSTIDLMDSEMYVKLGIYSDSGDFKLIPCGKFIVTEVYRKKKDYIKITALDKMITLDVNIGQTYEQFFETHDEVQAADITYEKGTFAWLMYHLIKDSGHSGNYSPKIDEWEDLFPNEVEAYKWTTTTIKAISNMANLTYRALLMNLCALGGVCAYFDGEGVLTFSWYKETQDWYSSEETFSITPADRYDSEINTDSNMGYEGVRLSNSYYPNRYVTDTSRYIRADTSYIAYEDDDSSLYGSLIANLWDKLGSASSPGGGYHQFNAQILSAPYLFPLDKINYYTDDGTAYPCLITHVNIRLNGRTTISGEEKPYADGNNGSDSSWQSSQTGQTFSELDGRVTQLEQGGGGGSDHYTYMIGSDGVEYKGMLKCIDGKPYYEYEEA